MPRKWTEEELLLSPVPIIESGGIHTPLASRREYFPCGNSFVDDRRKEIKDETVLLVCRSAEESEATTTFTYEVISKPLPRSTSLFLSVEPVRLCKRALYRRALFPEKTNFVWVNFLQMSGIVA